MLHNVAIIISSDWSEPGYNWDDVWDFCSKLCRLCHSIRKTIRPFCKSVTHHSSESQRAFVADLEWFWYSQGTRKFIISGLFGESAALIFLGLTPYIPLPSVTHHFFHNIQTPSVLCVRDSYPLYCHSPIFHIMHYSMFWTQAPLPLPMPSVRDVLLWPEFECGVSPIFCSQKWMVASSLVVLGFSISQIDIPVYSDLLNQAQWGNPCNYYNCEAIVNLNFSSLKLVDEDKKDALTCTVSGITAFSMSFGSGHY